MFDYIYILTVYDIVIPPILLLIIYLLSNKLVKGKKKIYPEYRYYIPGLFFKIIFALSLCFIYLFYYNGGDTIIYFEDASKLINLFYRHPIGALDIFFGDTSFENHMLFDRNTGYISSYWSDSNAFFVVRFIMPLVLITHKSYLSTTILLAWICYSGVWKLYLVFCREFPELKKKLAIAILFIPSVAFWGSGILKDTITLAAVCWFSYAIYMAIIPGRKNLFHPFAIAIQIFISIYLIVSMKPYVLYPLFPGVTFLVIFKYVSKIENGVVKLIVIPLVIGISFLVSTFLVTSLGDRMGRFSLDSALQNAVEVQYDLKQDYYQGSSFDIGEFSPTLGGALSKFPYAVTAGLFRPFIWEARNLAMLIAGIENMIFLIIAFRILINLRFIRYISYITTQPLLVYALSFSIILVFIVGLTTSNFGSLVRYRIPALPFYLASLFILEKQIADEKLRRRFLNYTAATKLRLGHQKMQHQPAGGNI